jgi:mono/diheme cytochrome c family protein
MADMGTIGRLLLPAALFAVVACNSYKRDVENICATAPGQPPPTFHTAEAWNLQNDVAYLRGPARTKKLRDAAAKVGVTKCPLADALDAEWAAHDASAVTAAAGQESFNKVGCIGCHTIDGQTLIGMSAKGLYGRQIPLEDGGTAVVNDAFIRECIRAPNARPAHSSQPGVHPYGDDQRLDDAEIDGIIAYIKTLH